MNNRQTDEADTMSLPAASSLLRGDTEECAARALPQQGSSRPTAPCQEDHERIALPAQKPAGKGSRMLVLDGLRAIAICMVMVHHYTQSIPKSGLGDRYFHGIANSCWIGVDLFFVLSGFLITGILYDAKGSPSYFRTFYIRRSLRIFPIYYILLLVVFIILPALHLSIVDPFTLSHARWFWLYGANYFTGLVSWPDRAVVHLWSLAIEEHFYLLWPVIVFIASKRQLLIGGAVFLFVAIGMRYYAAIHGTSSTSIYVMTHFRIDTLVMGGLLALCWKTPDLRATLIRHSGKAAILFLLVMVAWLVSTQGLDWTSWSPAQQAGGYTVIGLFFAAAHVVSLNLPSGALFYRILTCAPAIWLGQLSYGMYLFHRPIEIIAIKLGLHPSAHVDVGYPNWPYELAYILGNAAATALVAWITWNLFEKHVLRLKDRFIYQNSGMKEPSESRAAPGPLVTDAKMPE